MRIIKPPIPNARIDPCRDGVGVLSRDGEFAGYIATRVMEFWSPSSSLRMQWWVWYIVIWADGTQERSTEDYPPWFMVEEVRQGYFEWETRGSARNGRYEFAWLGSDEAASARKGLGIKPADF